MMFRISPTTMLRGATTNIDFKSNCIDWKDVTSDFLKFKFIYRKYMVDNFDIEISNETTKNIFLYTVFKMLKDKMQVLDNDSVVDYVNELVDVEVGGLDVYLNHEELIEDVSIVNLLDTILKNNIKLEFIDFVLYKNSIKCIFNKVKE